VRIVGYDDDFEGVRMDKVLLGWRMVKDVFDVSN